MVFLLIGAFLYGIADLLLIIFGTVMFSVILSSASTGLHRRFHIRRGLALGRGGGAEPARDGQ